jgi:hypothetical protein
MAQAPRDVDLTEWLDGIGFKPANTETKQLGHEYARTVVAGIGASLHDVLPPGRDKSIVYTLLEDVLMRSNKALAVGGGPLADADVTEMRRVVDAYGDMLPHDPRIAEYEADQLARNTEHSTRLTDAQLKALNPEHFTQEAVDAATAYVSPFKQHGHAGPHHELVAAEPKPTYRVTVGSTDPDIETRIVAERVSDSQGYVQVGVVSGVEWRGFYATFGDADELDALTSALHQARSHVWGDPPTE